MNIEEWILAVYGRNTATDNTNIELYKCYGSENEAKTRLSKYINEEAEILRQKGFIVNGTLTYDEFHVNRNDRGDEIGYGAFINVYDERNNYRIVYYMKKINTILTLNSPSPIELRVSRSN